MCTMNLLSIEISCYKRRFNICLLVSLASYYLWLPLTPSLYLPMLSGLHKVKKLDFLLFVLHVVVLRKKTRLSTIQKKHLQFLTFFILSTYERNRDKIRALSGALFVRSAC